MGENKQHPHHSEITIFMVLGHACHCANCSEEIIDGNHVLVPVQEDDSEQAGYVPLCNVCANDAISGGIQNEESEEKEDN